MQWGFSSHRNEPGAASATRGAPFLVAFLALSTCTPTTPPGPEPPVATETPPPRGGSAAVGLVGYPTTLDPYAAEASDLTRALARPVYPSLFRLDEEGRPAPDLALTLDDADGAARIELRRARWSDGSPIVASDVVATVRRARPPSGLAGLRADARGRRTVRLRGVSGDPELRLATAAPILPRGRAGGPYGGPFLVRSVRPGLQVTLARNPRFYGEEAVLDRVVVRSTQGLDIALGLLERGSLDAAALPSTVNLDERLDAAGIDYAVTPEGEDVYLDLSGADTTRRASLASALDLEVVREGLIRDDGEPVSVDLPPAGEGSAPETVRLAAPAGDELLELIQRIVQLQLERRGIEAELVTIDHETYYGPWPLEDPVEMALRRATSLAGRQAWERPGAGLASVPLFRVDAVLARGDRLRGADAGPNADGPLWNLQGWYREP